MIDSAALLPHTVHLKIHNRHIYVATPLFHAEAQKCDALDTDTRPHPVCALLRLISSIVNAHRIPDLEMVFNLLDEPRSYLSGASAYITEHGINATGVALHCAAHRAESVSPADHEMVVSHFSFASPGTTEAHPTPLPVFSTAKAPLLCNADIRFPDPDFALWGDRANRIYRLNKQIPWSAKRPTAYWRGATTGGVLTRENYESSPRIRLRILAEHDTRLDAALTGYPLINDPSLQSELMARFGVAPYASLEDHARAMALLDLDGNTYSIRTKALLLMNSVVLKQQSPYAEFWTSSLVPWKHYVPVDPQLRNLDAQVGWVFAHPAEAKRIARESTRWAAKHLSPASVERYAARLLSEYARRQTFTPAVSPSDFEVHLTPSSSDPVFLLVSLAVGCLASLVLLVAGSCLIVRRHIA